MAAAPVARAQCRKLKQRNQNARGEFHGHPPIHEPVGSTEGGKRSPRALKYISSAATAIVMLRCAALTQAERLDQRQHHGRGRDRADLAAGVRAHRMHQQVILLVVFLASGWTTRAAIGNAEMPAAPISGLILPPDSTHMHLAEQTPTTVSRERDEAEREDRQRLWP